jgi:hypothetical protein
MNRCVIVLLSVLIFSGLGALGADVAVWTESPGTMILASRPAGAGKNIVRSGVRNEYVCAQIGVRAGQDQDGPYAFEWGELSGPAGKITKDNITLFRAADIVVDHYPYKHNLKPDDWTSVRARPLGSFPDALVPLYTAAGENFANSIALKKEQTLSFWVDIYIPENTKPGAYSGTIQFKSGSAAVADIPLNLQVLDLTIPKYSTFPSLFNLRFYNHAHIAKNLDAYVEETLKHRLSPTCYAYVQTAMRDGFGQLDKLTPNGVGYTSVYVTNTQVDDKTPQTIESVKKITAHLKEKNLFEHSYLYLKDEPDQKDLQGIADFTNALLKEIPEWKGKTLCTLRFENAPTDAVVTHHVRIPPHYDSWAWTKFADRDQWDKWRSEGRQIWMYIGAAVELPFANYDVNAPNLAYEARVLPWGYWHEKAAGHLYWDLMFLQSWELSKKWPPGDGELMYPGDFNLPGAPSWTLSKDLHGPVVSRRLKLNREGLEEWELLTMAQKKVGREKVEAVVAKVYTALGKSVNYDPAHPMWSYNEADWDKARDEVIQLLLQNTKGVATTSIPWDELIGIITWDDARFDMSELRATDPRCRKKSK